MIQHQIWCIVKSIQHQIWHMLRYAISPFEVFWLKKWYFSRFVELSQFDPSLVFLTTLCYDNIIYIIVVFGGKKIKFYYLVEWCVKISIILFVRFGGHCWDHNHRVGWACLQLISSKALWTIVTCLKMLPFNSCFLYSIIEWRQNFFSKNMFL